MNGLLDITYAVWLADLSDTLDKTKLQDGRPIVPGDHVIWRVSEDTIVPIQAYESEQEAHKVADYLNGGY